MIEYAPGGELFDIIEPDVGITEDLAQLYIRQLCSGVNYMHQKGFTQNDLHILLEQPDIDIETTSVTKFLNLHSYFKQ